MSEDKNILYKIRWEILVMALSLVLSAVVVLAIPNDFTDKMLKQQKEESEAKSNTIEIEEQLGFNESRSVVTKP
ncbi:MAG: hypothetical protein V3T40_02430 [Nitrososphaerales archaeon]